MQDYLSPPVPQAVCRIRGGQIRNSRCCSSTPARKGQRLGATHSIAFDNCLIFAVTQISFTEGHGPAFLLKTYLQAIFCGTGLYCADGLANGGRAGALEVAGITVPHCDLQLRATELLCKFPQHRGSNARPGGRAKLALSNTNLYQQTTIGGRKHDHAQ